VPTLKYKAVWILSACYSNKFVFALHSMGRTEDAAIGIDEPETLDAEDSIDVFPMLYSLILEGCTVQDSVEERELHDYNIHCNGNGNIHFEIHSGTAVFINHENLPFDLNILDQECILAYIRDELDNEMLSKVSNITEDVITAVTRSKYQVSVFYLYGHVRSYTPAVFQYCTALLATWYKHKICYSLEELESCN
jgi:hypothetical protein